MGEGKYGFLPEVGLFAGVFGLLCLLLYFAGSLADGLAVDGDGLLLKRLSGASSVRKSDSRDLSAAGTGNAVFELSDPRGRHYASVIAAGPAGEAALVAVFADSDGDIEALHFVGAATPNNPASDEEYLSRVLAGFSSSKGIGEGQGGAFDLDLREGIAAFSRAVALRGRGGAR